MKTLILAAGLLAASLSAGAADVNLSVSIGQPGFYGRIDIGNFPQPEVINAEPVIIEQGRPYTGRPIYLRVPPGHAKHWDKYCRQYNACNQKVYFVNDKWYSDVYAAHYREEERRARDEHAHGRPPEHAREEHDKHDDKHDDRHDDKHDDKHHEH